VSLTNIICKSFSAILFSMFNFRDSNASGSFSNPPAIGAKQNQAFYISVSLSYYNNFYCQAVILINLKKFAIYIFKIYSMPVHIFHCNSKKNKNQVLFKIFFLLIILIFMLKLFRYDRKIFKKRNGEYLDIGVQI